MIYFVEIPNSHIKIGRTAGPASTRNMKARLKGLRGEFGREDLRVVFFLPEGPDISEQTLHVRMREHRIEGEWHARRPTLLLIDELRTDKALISPDDPVNQRTVQMLFSGSEIESVCAAASPRSVGEWLRDLARTEIRRVERERMPKRRAAPR